MAVIQLRSGAYADYDPAKMHAAEAAVILSGDPETADGKSMRIAFGAGDDKRLLTEDDTFEVDAELDALSEKPVQNKVIKSALDAKAPTASPTFTGTPTVPNAAAGTNTQQIASTKFVQDAVTSKAPIASPTFTGTPKAPTASAGTSTTQIATTAFVQNEINAIPTPVQKIWTGVCNTATSTKPKIVTLDDPDGFSLTAGVSIAVYFTNRNTTLSTTLNVNGTGAIPVLAAKYGSDQAAVSSVYASQCGVGIQFYTYDGTGWVKTNVDYTQFDYITTAKAPIASPTFSGTPKAQTAPAGTSTTQIATTEFVMNAINSTQITLSGDGTVTLSIGGTT